MIREPGGPLARDIEFLRSALGISQNEFARRCGIHESILSRLLNDKVVAAPSRRKVVRRVASELRALAREHTR